MNRKILILRIFLRKATILRKILRISIILRIRIFVNMGPGVHMQNFKQAFSCIVNFKYLKVNTKLATVNFIGKFSNVSFSRFICDVHGTSFVIIVMDMKINICCFLSGEYEFYWLNCSPIILSPEFLTDSETLVLMQTAS